MRVRREAWRQVRAWLCGCVAGPIAEQLYGGEEPWIDYDGLTWGPDAKDSLACDELLPWRDELEPLHMHTVQTLRRPEVWALVLGLADELERLGELSEEVERFLPARVPTWPPSPRAKKVSPLTG